jgi:putative transposase
VQQRVRGFFEGEAQACRYLVHLIDFIKSFRTRVLGWCVLPDELRMVAVPPDREALGRLLRATGAVYVRETNWLTDIDAPLLRERFQSCVLDQDYVCVAVREMELAPVRAGYVKKPEHWLWSSARYNLGLYPVDLLLRRRVLPEMVANWRQWLGIEDDKADAYLARCTRTGWPCGSKGFAELVGKRLRRKLVRRKPGPKPKEIVVWGGRRYGWYIRTRKPAK